MTVKKCNTWHDLCPPIWVYLVFLTHQGYISIVHTHTYTGNRIRRERRKV
ncbi:hypothetical protein HanXRQr2_Chr16g0751241 [Helianthus annuus]|uniref:Uncharacterized protein n=1 Tax=Helianthus annuus TaxID=4232 RepID=A0A9K3DSR8_HELAN|nr:hypothetical protein HanXRQr2_Chr16g0751241 [Helianthus annuus]KAJ0821415.1 hypothetical protein HanPSC8_Chr16g0719921 [Helianthus annuus]